MLIYQMVTLVISTINHRFQPENFIQMGVPHSSHVFFLFFRLLMIDPHDPTIVSFLLIEAWSPTSLSSMNPMLI